MEVAVVGGGIAGLAAAWELTGAGASVTLYEPGHLGGKLLTTDFLGRPVDEGPDAILARAPDGTDLCAEVGIGDELVAAAASKAMVWSGGHLHPLPDGLVLGAPARLLPLARSGMLSFPGMARAAADLVMPRSQVGEDAGVWELVARRFGREVADSLVQPLVGSIYAGTTKGMSAATVAPQLLAAAKSHRSLLVGLRRSSGHSTRSGADAPRPAFVAPRDGMQALVNALVASLVGRGTSIEPHAVSSLRADGAGVVTGPDGRHHDGAVVAVPASASAHLLAPLVDRSRDVRPGPDYLGDLAGTRFASVAVVTVGVDAASLTVPPELSGILVAGDGKDGLLMTACSFGTNKWPHWGDANTSVLRISVGRYGDDRWQAMTDEALVERALQELSTAARHLGTGSGQIVPVVGGWRVSRWPAALPEYPVGHLAKMTALRSSLERQAPTVALAGASYGRVGIPACISAGRQAATAVLEAARRRGGGTAS